MISHLKKLVSEFSSSSSAPKSGSCQNNTVLVVDDEAEMRTIGRIALEQSGYRVLEASDGAEALKIVKSSNEPIGLIVSDVMMPDIDGLTLVRRLKQMNRGIPVLLLSGHVVEEDLWGDSTSSVRYLSKPYHLTDLQNAVVDMIGPVLPVEA